MFLLKESWKSFSYVSIINLQSRYWDIFYIFEERQGENNLWEKMMKQIPLNKTTDSYFTVCCL